MCPEDFNIHIQKRNHKDKVVEQQSQRQNGLGHHLVRTTSMVLLNDNNGVSQHTNPKSNSSDSSIVHDDGNTDRSRSSSLEIPSNPLSTFKLENVINFEEVCRAITHSLKDKCTFRTAQRIACETKIIDKLSHHIKAFDSTLQLKIFGSASYGFGGPKTNLNILVNAGEKLDPSYLPDFQSIN